MRRGWALCLMWAVACGGSGEAPGGGAPATGPPASADGAAGSDGDTGRDAGSTQTGTGGDASASAIDGSTDAGASAATDAATAPEDAAFGDPEPVEVSLDGLVETSSRWLVYTEIVGSAVPTELMLIDLESGERHLVNPGGTYVAYASWSPDGATLLTSGANANSDRELFLLRLSEGGFVPATPVGGYQGVRGAFARYSWSADARFVAASRGGSESDGIELIDTARGARSGHVDLPNENASFAASFAPAGYYFSYYYRAGDSTRRFLARVIGDGSSSPPEELPGGSAHFDRSGARLFYAPAGAGGFVRIRQLPGGESELTVATGTETFNGSFQLGPDAESLVVSVEQSSGNRVYKRVYLDGRPFEVVSDPARSLGPAFASPSGGAYLFDYDGAVELADLARSLRVAVPTVNMRDDSGYFTIGFAHDRAYYRAADGLHLIAIDDAGALIDEVFEPGRAASHCSSLSDPIPRGKAVFRLDDGRELVFVDLSQDTPQVAGRMTASAESATLGCPRWEHGGAALAVLEIRESGRACYLVDWSGDTPGTPVLALESAGRIEPHAFMLR